MTWRPEPYRDRIALVTGGASGIGAALGRALAERGAEVVLADRQLELAERVARSIGPRASAVELDVRDAAAFERVASQLLARRRRIDLLLNNAGIGVGGEMDTYCVADWDDVIDVNLRGVAYGIQAVYPSMIRRGSGHIVNTASMAGLCTAAGHGSYVATKHAVVGLSKALRVEARRHGVRVSVLCPGVIRTPILRGGTYGRLNLDGLSEARLAQVWERFRPMDADAFARGALDAVARDEAIIVLPRWWKALWYLERLSPRLGMALWGSALDRVRAELEASGAKPRTAASAPSTVGSTS
ncbi:MAG: SDR family oxidoreductase [Deltaproteobacteria bacterium]|nr:SDR family oxidoreductase [Deltaproteobacteria bacterium]